MRPVILFGLLASFVTFAWLITGMFEENDWSDCHDFDCKDPITVTESFICMEAFIFVLMVFPVLISELRASQRCKKEFSSLIRFLDREPEICTVYRNEEGNAVKPVCNITYHRGVFFKHVSFRRPSTTA
jgi:hypothetical protein